MAVRKKSHFFSRPGVESGNLRRRKEDYNEGDGRKQCRACDASGQYVLRRSLTHPPPTPTATLPGRRGLTYLDDAAAPGGSPRRLQEASLAVRRGPSSDRQHDPAATVPRPTPKGRSHAVPGGTVRAHSGVVFTPGCVGRRGTLPAGRALGHGWARFGLSSGRRRRSPAAGEPCAQHQEAAPPDFVSPPARGGKFLERRHRWNRDVLGL